MNVFLFSLPQTWSAKMLQMSEGCCGCLDPRAQRDVILGKGWAGSACVMLRVSL